MPFDAKPLLSHAIIFLRQILLLILIPSGHFCKTVVGELTGNIVLIDTLKQSVQFFITGLQGCKLFFFELAVKCYTLLRATHNGLYKIVLIMARKLCQPLYFTKHYMLQEIHTDIMGRGTSPSVALVVGTVEILDFGIALIEYEI